MERATRPLSASILRPRTVGAFITRLHPTTRDRTPGVMIAILGYSKRANGLNALKKRLRSRFSARAVTIRSENGIKWFGQISKLMDGSSEMYPTSILPSRFKNSRLKRKNEDCVPVIWSNFFFSFWKLKTSHAIEGNGCGFGYFEKLMRALSVNLIMTPEPKVLWKLGKSFSSSKIKFWQFTNKPFS